VAGLSAACHPIPPAWQLGCFLELLSRCCGVLACAWLQNLHGQGGTSSIQRRFTAGSTSITEHPCYRTQLPGSQPLLDCTPPDRHDELWKALAGLTLFLHYQIEPTPERLSGLCSLAELLLNAQPNLNFGVPLPEHPVGHLNLVWEACRLLLDVGQRLP
jgi:hypothetical protein